MKYLTILFAFSLCILTKPGYAQTQPANAAQHKYRIAVIIPLTGPVSSLGLYVKNGIDLAYSGLSKDKQDKLELIYEDDQYDPKRTLSAYRNFKNSPAGIDAVFVIGSSTANALSPILERDKTILMAIGASDPTIAVGKRYSFIHWVIPSVLGKTLAAELKRRDFKRICFVTADVSGTIADMDAAVDSLKANGMGDRIVYKETFPKDENDYRTAITQLREKKADVVVAALFPGALSSFAKQFKTLQSGAELSGMETFEDEGEVKNSNGAMNGAWYANASDPTPEFIREYTARYHEHPGWGTANGYDSVRLIAAAVAAEGSGNEKVRDYLVAVKDYSGAAGTYSASGDNRFTLPAALKQITDKGFEPLMVAGKN